VVPGKYLSDIACPTTSECLAVGFDNDINGFGVVVAVSPAGAVEHVTTLKATPWDTPWHIACASSSLCVGVGDDAVHDQGVVFTFDGNGNSRTTTQVASVYGYNDVACPSPSFCEGAGAYFTPHNVERGVVSAIHL
jgi:hypothetical protein